MKYDLIKKITIIIITFILLTPLKIHADDLLPAVEHLLTYMESNRKAPLNLDLIPQLLNFVDKPKALGETMTLGERNGTASDYYEFYVNKSLSEVLDLTYNPDLPRNLALPSSVRRSQWIKYNDKNMTLPRLSTKLNHLNKPVIIKGIEYVENTPDLYSGVYYSYNDDRLLILITYKGRPALISVSNQTNKSDVGKKGLILGNDEEWNYIYSGEKGTTLRVAGWADTYMYGSASIAVYYELGMNTKRVKCAVFKWVNAGWMGMNFVKPVHIRKGLMRFAKDFRKIVESPSLADTESLVKMYQNIQNMSLNELRTKIAAYYNQKNITRFQLENSKNKKMIKKLFKNDKYINSLNRQEMEALVSIEYLKYKMGKHNLFESDCFQVSYIDEKKYQK